MKLTNNVKMFITGTFILAVGILLVVVGNSIASPNSTILKDQVVENLSFKNASLEYENNITTFEVDVTNNHPNEYNLKYIEILFMDEEKNVNKMIGYIGNSLKKDETKKITARIDKDLTNSISLEYFIIK